MNKQIIEQIEKEGLQNIANTVLIGLLEANRDGFKQAMDIYHGEYEVKGDIKDEGRRDDERNKV